MSSTLVTATMLAHQRGRFHDALLRAGELSPLQRIVGLVLLSYVNRDTGEAWPSLARLSGEAGVAERSVRDTLDMLVRQGWFERQTRLGRTNRYEPCLDKPSPTLPFGGRQTTPRARIATPANDSSGAAEATPANDSNIDEVAPDATPAKDSKDPGKGLQAPLESFADDLLKNLDKNLSPAEVETVDNSAPPLEDGATIAPSASETSPGTGTALLGREAHATVDPAKRRTAWRESQERVFATLEEIRHKLPPPPAVMRALKAEPVAVDHEEIAHAAAAE